MFVHKHQRPFIFAAGSFFMGAKYCKTTEPKLLQFMVAHGFWSDNVLEVEVPTRATD